jgi:hypothetical protein
MLTHCCKTMLSFFRRKVCRASLFFSRKDFMRIYTEPNRYGFFNFLLDIIMIFATAGLWFIWIIIRELKKG